MHNTEGMDANSCDLIAGRYRYISHLGQGTYGNVAKVVDVSSGQFKAVKTLTREPRDERCAMAPSIIREIGLLSGLRHPHILTLEEVVVDPAEPERPMLVLELMDTDLRGYIETNAVPGGGLPFAKFTDIALQLLIGVRFGHSNAVLHRDIKPQNVLLTADGTVAKVGDWGLARRTTTRVGENLLTREIVTLWYRPPELILGASYYGPEVDTWSLALIFVQMLTGVPLVHGRNAIATVCSIFAIFGTPVDDYYYRQLPYFSENLPRYKSKGNRRTLRELLQPKLGVVPCELVDVLAGMLALNPTERISVKEAIWSPFFDKARKKYVAARKAAAAAAVVA